MLDERAYIAQVESASPEQFSEMLSTADQEEQSALRASSDPTNSIACARSRNASLFAAPLKKKGISCSSPESSAAN